MGDAAFRTGWRVYRAHRPDTVDPARTRRRSVLATSVAVLVGALLTVTLVVWRWSPAPLPFAALGVLAVAAAAGSLTASLVPIAPPRTDWSFRPTGDWRRSERIARQFAPRPPAIAPEDRDGVLAATEDSRTPLVLSTERALFLPGTWLAVLVGLALLGQFDGAAWSAVLFVPLVGLLQSATLVASVTALGRAELARRRAEALPPSPPPPPERPRGRGPTGTKLGLPD